MSRIRTVFMGTPAIATPSLEALIADERIDLVGVVAQPDRPKGRSMRRQAPPTKEVALARSLRVLQPESAKDPEFIASIEALEPDVAVVMAYGQILRPRLLAVPKHGCVNIHTSLLPKYRGAAPIQWAVYHGESETGITLIQMDPGMDTGPTIAKETTDIGDRETASELSERLSQIAASLLLEALPRYVAGELALEPQDDRLATMAPKLEKADGHIDWSRDARSIDCQIRAFSDWPGAYADLRRQNEPPIRIKILSASPTSDIGEPGRPLLENRRQLVIGCGADALRVERLQRPGAKPMTADAFLAGLPLDASWLFE